MPGFVRDGGVWKPITDLSARDAGVWRDVKKAYVRDGGVWKQFFSAGFIGFIRPDGDIESSDWTSTPLWQKLDEVAQDNATTEITTIFTGINSQTRDFEIRLSDPGDPPSGNEVITLRTRFWLDEIIGLVNQREVKIQLKQGTTVKKTINTFANLSGYVTTNSVLSQAQKDSITNWNDLRVKLAYTVRHDSEFHQSNGKVTWIEMQFS